MVVAPTSRDSEPTGDSTSFNVDLALAGLRVEFGGCGDPPSRDEACDVRWEGRCLTDRDLLNVVDDS